MKYPETDWRSNQSTTIDLLRFPLAIAVIFIHMNPETINLLEADFSLLSGRGVYNVVGIILSHVFTHIAVPTFFLISGFLFFLNFKKLTWDGYKKKMKSRKDTLIIPYIVWNILTFGIIILMKIGGVLVKGKSWQGVWDYIQENGLHIFLDCNIWGMTRENIVGWPAYRTGPIDLPLWFLRDLIVVSVLAPFIYWFIKRTKVWGVFLLFAAYVTRIWILTPGFSITAFFYFTLGAYFAINGKNMVAFARHYRLVFIPVSLLLFCACVIFDGSTTTTGDNIYPFYIAATVFATLAIASVWVEKYNLKANPLLVNSCFFVYAAHTVPIFLKSPIELARSILHHIIPGNSGLEEVICYLTVPFLTAAICVVAYYVLSRYIPKLASPLTGNR